MGGGALSGALWLGLLWAGSGAGGSCSGKCCEGRDAACVGEGWREGGGYGTCYCDGGCRRTGDCCHDHGQACPVKGSCRHGPSLLAQQHTMHARESWYRHWCPGRGRSLWTHTHDERGSGLEECGCPTWSTYQVASRKRDYWEWTTGQIKCPRRPQVEDYSCRELPAYPQRILPLDGCASLPCIVGEWSHWSGCAEQCQPDLRIRRRYVQQEPKNGGEPCPALEEKAGCLEYLTYQGEDCGHEHVPAFITTSEYGKERKRRAASSLWPSDKETAGYCVEFKTESLSHHCALENRPYARWMQYLREGHTVCVACQPPAMNTDTHRCSGDGHNADGGKILHWEAVGNSQCQGTWKKIRQLEHCSCPLVHSFIFT